MAYFGVTANDIISLPKAGGGRSGEKSTYLEEINALLEDCSDNQLAVVLNVLRAGVPFLKD